MAWVTIDRGTMGELCSGPLFLSLIPRVLGGRNTTFNLVLVPNLHFG